MQRLERDQGPFAKGLGFQSSLLKPHAVWVSPPSPKSEAMDLVRSLKRQRAWIQPSLEGTVYLNTESQRGDMALIK